MAAVSNFKRHPDPEREDAREVVQEVSPHLDVIDSFSLAVSSQDLRIHDEPPKVSVHCSALVLELDRVGVRNTNLVIGTARGKRQRQSEDQNPENRLHTKNRADVTAHVTDLS